MRYEKKLFGCLCSVLLVLAMCVTPVFAETNVNSIPEVEATEPQNVGMQGMDFSSSEEKEKENIPDLNKIIPDDEKVAANIPPNALQKRDVWGINDPVFVGNGTLDESFDIYVLTLTQKQLAFLKMSSSNSNLMAILYYINPDGSLGDSSGWGVYANSDASYINIPAGRYALVIGSGTGNERGNYKLMWNAANPAGASSIIDYTDDLARVVLYYNNSTIRSNGTNIVDGLTWEEHETWSMPSGYSGRDMVMEVFGVKGVYMGNFSSSKPYSAPNSLLIEISKGSWHCMNSYYKNVEGNVTHVMDYYDLSGLKTPRTFGQGVNDFAYGPSFIIINLDTFQVCEFLSPFNFNYNEGRTYSLNNLVRIG